jgi:alanine racemase
VTRAHLTIDLDALAANHAVLRAAASGAEVAPVVKADGYGLGAGPVARRLWAEGAHTFFVARLSEGAALRAALGAGRPATIFVLDGPGSADLSDLQDADLTPVLNSPEDVSRWRPTGAPAALHIDTGMNRLGVTADEARASHGLNIVHVMSHLACAADAASPRNRHQLDRFRAVRTLFPGATASLSASAGVFLGADFAFDLVRPGISLYGGGPLERPDDRFRAVARLHAPILQVRRLSAGDAVGYGDGFVANRPMVIGLLAAGYADGLLRRGKGKAMARLNGAPAPILIVSMDLIAVDLSAAGEARAGDRVELLGENALLDDLAAATDTVAHECLVRLSARAERVYMGAAA